MTEHNMLRYSITTILNYYSSSFRLRSPRSSCSLHIFTNRKIVLMVIFVCRCFVLLHNVSDKPFTNTKVYSVFYNGNMQPYAKYLTMLCWSIPH